MNGKKNKHNVKHSLFCFFCLFFVATYAQKTVKGVVSNVQGEKIAFAVVEFFENSEKPAYTYTNENGFFEIKSITHDTLHLKISSLGFHPYSVLLNTNDTELTSPLTFTLSEKAIALDEVIVRAKKPIIEKKDTITLQTRFFTDGTEQTVEDMLKKIPGLQIDNEGTIKVGNTEIEKLMVEGDDFFERGYKVLSKNMPAHPIKGVEVLKNYSNNRLLKGIENSHKVALNLKLKEEAKHVWFGNIDVGYGILSENRYDFGGNLMNFGKKNKYYFLTNLNNIGRDATGNIQHLIKPMQMGATASVGDNQQIANLINLSPPYLNFKRERTNFNNAELMSLNAIFNPTEKLKIKLLGFFNWDETLFFNNTIDVVNTTNLNFTNTENYILEKNTKTAFSKIDITYNIAENQMFEATTKYNNGDFNDSTHLLFNNNATIENLIHKNTLFDQQISYTNKFKEKKVLSLTGRYIDETAPQQYRINQFYYADLFPNFNNTTNVAQRITNRMQFAGLNAHLLNRTKKEHLWEIHLGNEFRKDRLSSIFSLFEEHTLLNNPNGYQNRTVYQTNNLYLKTKYHHTINKLTIIAEIDFHQLFNKMIIPNFTTDEHPFYANPNIGLEWEINPRNKITSSYTYSTTNAKTSAVFSDFILTGFRSFSKGTADFNQLEQSSFVFNYQLGKWSERFFANTFFVYSKNHNFLSTNTTIEQNYTTSEKIVVKDRKFININSTVDYYFRAIANNLKLDIGYNQSSYKNIINDLLREITSLAYRYGFELRSGFSGMFNYHLGTKWHRTEIESTTNNAFTNNISFLDLTFICNKNLYATLQSERYYFGNLSNNNTYYFLDVNVTYKMNDKLTFALIGRNIFNTKTFRSFSISDIGSSTTEYRLLPRFALLKVNYRF